MHGWDTFLSAKTLHYIRICSKNHTASVWKVEALILLHKYFSLLYWLFCHEDMRSRNTTYLIIMHPVSDIAVYDILIVQ